MTACRSVLVENVVLSVYSALTGLLKTPHTSSSRSSWLIHSTSASVLIPRFSGSASLCTSTESYVVLHQLESLPGVLEKVIPSTRPREDLAGQTGAKTTPSVSEGNVNELSFKKYFLTQYFLWVICQILKSILNISCQVRVVIEIN